MPLGGGTSSNLGMYSLTVGHTGGGDPEYYGYGGGSDIITKPILEYLGDPEDTFIDSAGVQHKYTDITNLFTSVYARQSGMLYLTKDDFSTVSTYSFIYMHYILDGSVYSWKLKSRSTTKPNEYYKHVFCYGTEYQYYDKTKVEQPVNFREFQYTDVGKTIKLYIGNRETSPF